MNSKDEFYMQKALDEAKKAYELKEVPVGAVIVYNGKIISTGFNNREQSQNAIYHAEIIAINKACEYFKSWRLVGCELYVTLEPCPMCAGAIINSRISKVIYAAPDLKSGCCGSIVNIFELPFNHTPQIVGGILKEDSIALLQKFFSYLRKNKNL